MGEDVTTRLLETIIFEDSGDSGLFHTSLGGSWMFLEALGICWNVLEALEPLESFRSLWKSWKLIEILEASMEVSRTLYIVV